MPVLFSLLYTLPDHNVISQKCEKKSDYLKRLYVTTFWQSNTKPESFPYYFLQQTMNYSVNMIFKH